jgi:aspartate/methionine/tyrosine aminotransferase
VDPFARNRFFQQLGEVEDLAQLGRNTNHLPTPPNLVEAMLASIRRGDHQHYAPPLGLSELHELILQDLGLTEGTVWITNGATEGIVQIARTLLQPGDEVVLTDPGYYLLAAHAEQLVAKPVYVPVYETPGRHVTLDLLERAINSRTRLVYLVDPLNPLGSRVDAEVYAALARRLVRQGTYVLQDATYRDFAEDPVAAARLAPDRVLTTYSLSKFAGLAGLRVGAVVGTRGVVARLVTPQSNNLGASLLGQRVAVEALRTKAAWFPERWARQRENQRRLVEALGGLPGLRPVLYPSHGNFVAFDVTGTDWSATALCTRLLRDRVCVRQGTYNSLAYGERFFRVSTTAPDSWLARCVASLVTVLRDERPPAASPAEALY